MSDSLLRLFEQICKRLQKTDRTKEIKTSAMIELTRKHSDLLKEVLGEEVYQEVWIKQPHLRSQLIINNGKILPPLTFDANITPFLDLDLVGKPYKHLPCYPLSSVHLGQRKLLVTEIFFLTNYGHLSNTIVYAGAADGAHIPVLCEMFPDKHFHLYDPSSFSPHTVAYSKKNPDRMTITQSLFPPKEIDELQEIIKDGFLLISDIRSKSSSDSHHPDEEDVEFDMALQKNWVKKLKPLASSLKFRLPYLSADDKDIVVLYMRGDILKQPWAPLGSTETRLISTLEDNEAADIEYSARRYESVLFEHNMEFRCASYRMRTRQLDLVRGDYDTCFDCSMEKFIISQYISKFGEERELKYIDLFNMINKVLPREQVRLLR